MPNRKLGLPDSPRKLLYLKLIAALKADPTLKRVIVEWKTFADECPTEAAKGPTAFPAAQIMPYSLPASPETDRTVSSPLGVRITLYVEGFEDCFDLWNAFEAVLLCVTGPDSLYSKLKQTYSLFVNLRMTQPAITPNDQALPKAVWMATGTVSLELQVPKR